MRLLFFIILVLGLAIAVGIWAQNDPGYVLLGRGYYTVEMSLVLFIVLLATAFVSLYFVLRISARVWHMPESLRHWQQQHHLRQVQARTRRGLLHLAQGDWAKAERELIKSAADSETPLLNYLSAARAAQKQQATERRDRYLALAEKSMKKASFAVEVTQAELQMANGQLQDALTHLQDLHAREPKHPHVLLLLAQLYPRLQGWGDLRQILPALRKQKLLNQEELHDLEKEAHRHLLDIAARQGKPEMLIDAFKRIPKNLRLDVDLLKDYVAALLYFKQYDTAEIVLREAVQRHWDEDLVLLYGLTEAASPEKQLSHAEKWIRGHETNAVQLLTLGRLSLRAKLWGKARSYLEASLGGAPRIDTYRELGQLLEQLDEKGAALECFRKGMLLSSQSKTTDPLVAAYLPESLMHPG